MSQIAETGCLTGRRSNGSKSILAFGGDELLEKVLSSPRSHYTENTLVDDDDLRRQLTEIRARGHSVSRSERIEGAIAIGTPIVNADDSVSSCLSLFVPAFRIENRIEEFGALLKAAAGDAQRVLG